MKKGLNQKVYATSSFESKSYCQIYSKSGNRSDFTQKVWYDFGFYIWLAKIILIVNFFIVYVADEYPNHTRQIIL